MWRRSKETRWLRPYRTVEVPQLLLELVGEQGEGRALEGLNGVREAVETICKGTAIVSVLSRPSADPDALDVDSYC